jgi:hypothetical protein
VKYIILVLWSENEKRRLDHYHAVKENTILLCFSPHYYRPLHPHRIYKTVVYFTTYKPCHLVTFVSFMKAIQKYNSGWSCRKEFASSNCIRILSNASMYLKCLIMLQEKHIYSRMYLYRVWGKSGIKEEMVCRELCEILWENQGEDYTFLVQCVAGGARIGNWCCGSKLCHF